jgi:hypothetical protein
VRWTLADALRIALENNLDLLSARKDPAIAEQQVFADDARFDGVIGRRGDYSGHDRPTPDPEQ